MGARQSYLYIYIKNKEKSYSENGYSVTPSIQSVDDCKNFEVVTHKIVYTKGNDTNFDIYLYETEDKNPNAYYFFAYCSPGTKTHVAKEVKVYYSILGPHIPLMISFVRDKDTINCDIDKLRRDRWNWAAYITDYSLGTDLKKPLEDAFKKTFWNRTIEFEQGSKPTSNVIVFPQRIDNKNYRIIFIPNKGDPVLNVKCLFSFDTTFKSEYKSYEVQAGCQNTIANVKNQIDSYFLESLKKVVYYNGIIVYYARENEQQGDVSLKEKHNENSALLVEFVNSCETVSLKRKDKNSSWWAEEGINYNNHAELTKALEQLKQDVNSSINAVILEKTSKYHGLSDFKEDKNKAYSKYTHKFATLEKTVFLFERKTITIGSGTVSDVKAKNVDVCYLKAGDNNDTKPFLIALYENDDPKLAKVCHFNNKDEFKDWEDLKPMDKLEDKLKKISESGSCSTHVFWLRKVAFYILTTDQPPPDDPPKEPDPPKRPTVDDPLPEPPPGRNWWLIIGCSVGGFLFLVALVVGYAIYWYNTTIKLLT